MSVRIWERRLQMARMIVAGGTPTAIIRELQATVGVTASERTLWKDYTTRGKWLPTLMKIEADAKKLHIAETLMSLKESRRYATLIMIQARSAIPPNYNGAVGGLNSRVVIDGKIVALLQHMGVVAPDKVIVELESPDVDWEGLFDSAVKGTVENFMESEARRLFREVEGLEAGADEPDSEEDNPAHPT